MPKLLFQMPELRFQKENLIYENFWLIGFEQISGHSILTIWNITQKISPCRNFLTENIFWLPAKKLNI
jgi:hypothetical protein